MLPVNNILSAMMPPVTSGALSGFVSSVQNPTQQKKVMSQSDYSFQFLNSTAVFCPWANAWALNRFRKPKISTDLHSSACRWLCAVFGPSRPDRFGSWPWARTDTALCLRSNLKHFNHFPPHKQFWRFCSRAAFFFYDAKGLATKFASQIS